MNWLICALHTNELLLRHLLVELDGKTLSNNKWSGELGKMLGTVTELNTNRNFEAVTLGKLLIVLPDKILKDLLTDQAYGYRIVIAIRTGVLPENLINLEISPVSYSRWLTTANRFCRLWISFHFLTEKNFKNLRLIIEFIASAYYPCWFQIKIMHSWLDGPRHVLFQFKQLNYQKVEVITIVKKTVIRSAWFAFSEWIIQTLLCSNNKEEQKLGVQKMLEIRGKGDDNTQFGYNSVRCCKIPSINTDADNLMDLIELKDSVYEPLLTTYLTTHEVKEILQKPIVVLNWPCHSQPIESCLKQVFYLCNYKNTII